MYSSSACDSASSPESADSLEGESKIETIAASQRGESKNKIYWGVSKGIDGYRCADAPWASAPRSVHLHQGPGIASRQGAHGEYTCSHTNNKNNYKIIIIVIIIISISIIILIT